MENKEPKTIRLTTVVLLLIILVLAVALVLMYIYYNSDTKMETIAATNTNNSMTLSVTNADENGKKELDINDSMVQKLYEYIPDEVDYDDSENRLKNAYQSKKVTIDDLDDELVLGHAFANIEIPVNERIAIDETTPVTAWYKAKPNRLQDMIKQMYNTEFENKGFVLKGTYGSYEDGMYTFSFGGGGNQYESGVQNIEEAYEENDELYIIDSYLWYSSEHSEDGSNSEILKVYNPANNDYIIKREVISEIDLLEKEDIYVKENYFSEAPKYKHTFKKNDAGEYYWYSSEPYTE